MGVGPSGEIWIGDFRPQRPRFTIKQEQSLAWLAAAHARAEWTRTNQVGLSESFRERLEKVIHRVCCAPSQIASRGSELSDFEHTRWNEMAIYRLDENPQGRGMRARTEFFANAVANYFDRAYAEEVEPPGDLIHVTCTGYLSPSGAQRLVARRGFSDRTRVTHAYHMGCYAAFPALRIAGGFAHSPSSFRSHAGARIDIAHTELCTLHLDPSQHSPEQLVVQSLFADGYIRYSVAQASDRPGLKVLALDEAILPDSTASMSWMCSEWGMQMTLARDVPERIAKALLLFLRRLYARAGLDLAERRSETFFAVHPGGPKIIDRVRDVLELSEAQVSMSREVLRRFGNMSSATLPHVWGELVAAPEVPTGSIVASLAFGPGLTVCGALMVKQ